MVALRGGTVLHGSDIQISVEGVRRDMGVHRTLEAAA